MMNNSEDDNRVAVSHLLLFSTRQLRVEYNKLEMCGKT